MVSEVKNRRINKNDIKKVEEFITAELESRKTAQFRKDKEEKWLEIDRQLAMKPMERVDTTGKKLPKSWHNVFELGELSKASEIIAADTIRITFPSDRKYFETHVEVPLGDQEAEKAETGQRKADGVLRSLMLQQQQDFGFRERFEVSVKEALHHGSFVAVAKWHKEKMVRQGDKVKFLGAPVWMPYSMWNSYPDPSPSIVPSGIFYQGSMIVVEYMPLWRLKKQSGDGWMTAQYKDIKTSEKETKPGVNTKDIELAHYYGDLFIDRKNEESGIYLPNSHAITANGTLVYYAANDLPFSPVIYTGYERQDIRDPYYTSPLEKQSPVQKIATICANKYLDGVALATEPPGEYDANDPDYVAQGGPVIAPGAQTATRSMGKGWNTLKTGDPNHALQGLQMCLRQMQEGTGVSALRSGTPNSDRQTATEIQKVSQGSEVRTVDFVSKLETRAIRPYLYMAHELNRMYLEDYPFYNDEMNTPDFMRASKDDIDFPSHFDVIGSKGLLGEEQRTQRVMQTTQLFSSIPFFATHLRPIDIMLDGYRDAGKKNPEEFVKVPKEGEQAPDQQLEMMKQQLQEQMQEKMQEVGKQIQQKEKEIQSAEQQVKAGEEKVRAGEDALQKKSNDLSIREIQIKTKEELLGIKQKVDSFQDGVKNEREAEKKKGAQAQESKAPEVEKDDTKVIEKIESLAESIKEIKDEKDPDLVSTEAIRDRAGNMTSVKLAYSDGSSRTIKTMMH